MGNDDRGPTGIAVIDKEAGWTSHDVVARARKVLGTRKVGHSGTLDPDATGVLVLGVGRATRLLRFLTGFPKSYTARIVLGAETSTLDASGEITSVHDMTEVCENDVRLVADGLVGKIEQTPPMVSAVRVGGRRLYEIAREGGEVDRAPRPVTIHRFEVTATGDPLVYEISVDCSSGTYVRVLAADLGTALGGGAHLRDLRRVAVGSFTLEEAQPVDGLNLLPAAAGLRDLPGVTIDEATVAEVTHGKVLDRGCLAVSGKGPWPIHGPDGTLIAVYEEYRGRVKPAVVLVG